ncbi:MAG: hypothetical protein HOO96_02355 [Polyangiaceae bacterium]|nr:hypothetical protein [Polyangiaceae bacterium]
MLREFMTKTPMLGLPIITLFLFITIFTTVFLRVMLRKETSYAAAESLPLEDGDDVSRKDAP